MSKYAIVNSENIVENVCVWDGVSDWSPCHIDDTLIEVVDGQVQAGDIMNEDQTFTRPIVGMPAE